MYTLSLLLFFYDYPYHICIYNTIYNTLYIGAIAAGNCAIIKPSEIAHYTEQKFMELIPKYMDTSCIEAVCGGVETSSKLLGGFNLETTIITYTHIVFYLYQYSIHMHRI